MARHTLRIDYDDATGELTVTHRCAVEVGGQAVSIAEQVMPSDAAGSAAALKGWIDANRAEMEAAAQRAAIQHAAAVAGKVKPGVKQLKVGGSLGPAGKV